MQTNKQASEQSSKEGINNQTCKQTINRTSKQTFTLANNQACRQTNNHTITQAHQLESALVWCPSIGPQVNLFAAPYLNTHRDKDGGQRKRKREMYNQTVNEICKCDHRPTSPGVNMIPKRVCAVRATNQRERERERDVQLDC